MTSAQRTGVRFVFQQSFIWDGGGTRPDPSQPKRKIKLPPTKASVEQARKKLPPPDLGRNWVCVEIVDPIAGAVR